MKPDTQPPTTRPQATRSPIQFVDGHYFFCRRLQLPDAIPTEEIPAFVELSLEELSPFPIEQLSWGWIIDAAGQQAFLYAACRPRLPAEVTTSWDEAHHVFPSFLPLLLLPPSPQASCAAIRSPGGLTLLRFEPSLQLPAQLISEPLSPDADDQAVRLSLQRLRQRLRLPSNCVDYGIYGTAHAERHKNALAFSLSPYVDSSASSLISSPLRLEGDDFLWQADIREDSFISSERQRRRTEDKINKALAAAGIGALILLLIFILNFIGGSLVKRREALVNAQSDTVAAIQQSSDFLVQLSQFSGTAFHPFGILGVANEVLRERQPRVIEFKSASVGNNLELIIQGESPNVEEVNLYSERLRRSPYFTTVELADVRTRSGRVTFTLNLTFNPESTIPSSENNPDETSPAEETSSTTDE